MSIGHYSTSQFTLNNPANNDTSSVYRNDPAVTIFHVDQPSSLPDGETLGRRANKRTSPNADLGDDNAVYDEFECVLREYIEKRKRWRKMLSTVRNILPYSRTAKCQHDRIPGQQFIDIKRGKSGRNGFTNLQRCSSVWICPRCASLITEQRRSELNTAIYQNAAVLGLFPVMVTLTFSHHAGMSLNFQYELLSGRSAVKGQSPAIKGARGLLLSGAAWSRIKERYGIVGWVHTFEILRSARGNGWHSHVHMILLLNIKPTDRVRRSLELALSRKWLASLRKAGNSFGATITANEHGCKVTTDNSKLADYIAKFGKLPKQSDSGTQWNAASELTKAQVKHRKEGFNIWELLEMVEAGDEQAAGWVREYNAVTNGRRQLNWSNGLRELLGVKFISDDEIVADEENELEERIAKVSARLDRNAWAVVCQWKLWEDVLYASEHGFDAIQELLSKHGAMAIRPANEDQPDVLLHNVHTGAEADRTEAAADQADDLDLSSEAAQAATPVETQPDDQPSPVVRYMQRYRYDLSEWHVTGKIPIKLIDSYRVDRPKQGDRATYVLIRST